MHESLAQIPRMTNYDESTDDHAFLRSYRDEAALAISPAGFPIALRHSAIGALTDPSTTRQLETESIRQQGITAGPIYELFSRSMLFSNGGLHKKRRGPIARTFAFKLMEGMRGEVSRIAGDIVTTAKGEEQLDFLDAFAGEIPARVIAQILELPESEMPRFRKLVYSVTRAFKVGFDQSQQDEIERDFAALITEVDGLAAERKGQPRDDFLSRRSRRSPVSHWQISHSMAWSCLPDRRSQCASSRRCATSACTPTPSSSTSSVTTIPVGMRLLGRVSTAASVKRLRAPNSKNAWRRSRALHPTPSCCGRRSSAASTESAGSIRCGSP